MEVVSITISKRFLKKLGALTKARSLAKSIDIRLASNKCIMRHQRVGTHEIEKHDIEMLSRDYASKHMYVGKSVQTASLCRVIDL